MTKDSTESEGQPAWLELVVAYRLFIGGFLSLGLLGLLAYVLLVGVPAISIGQNLKVAFFALFFTVPVGAIAAKPIVNWLYSSQYRYLVVLGLDDQAGVWKLSPSAWADLDVTEGSLHQFEVTEAPLYSARSFDPEALEAVGTWRGSLSDRDLLRALSKVDECRGMLEDDAKRGFAIETQAFTIVRSATREAVRSVVDTFESGTLPDEGDAIAESIDDAIEQFDLDSDAEAIESEPAVSDDVRSDGGAAEFPGEFEPKVSVDD